MSTPKAIKTNSAILAAARNVVRSRGIDALSMDQVAKEAGVSKGAVMYHFPTKKALQAALIQDYAEHMAGELHRHEARFEGDAIETFIPGYVEWFKSFDRDNRGWSSVGVQLLGQQSKDPALLKPVADFYEQLFSRVEKLPTKQRNKMLLAIMALEGFFFVHKFALANMDPERKTQILDMILEMTGTADVPAKNDASEEAE